VYVYHLIIDSGFRNNGIDRALVGRCIERLKESGIEKSHVFVFKDNEIGIGFCKKIGFELRRDLLVMSMNVK
jgi:N-acetylglutamate synthase